MLWLSRSSISLHMRPSFNALVGAHKRVTAYLNGEAGEVPFGLQQL